jgi:hypothetical protein
MIRINKYYRVHRTVPGRQFIVYTGLFICLLTGANLLAQDASDDKPITNQIWMDYNPSYGLGERMHIYGTVGIRTVFPQAWNRYYIKPSVKYQMRKLFFKKLYYKEELHAGVGIYLTNNRNSKNRLELRPFQGYRLAWPNRPFIVIQHYIRLEERFDLEMPSWTNKFGLRLRYRAELILRLKGKLIELNKNLYVPISLELFWNLIGTKQFNDAARIIPGIGYKFSPAWKGEFHVGYHYTRNSTEDNFATNDFVFRIRIIHSIEQIKKKK